MRAPRARACSAVSRTTTPDPSPSTNPSRALSNGRDAASGSSLRVDIARIAANPAIGSGWMTASVPPATTMSARPARRMSSAHAIASAPVAQALVGACTPALAPSSNPTQAAGPWGISIGTVCGLTLRGPDASRMSSWLSSVTAPPMPLPTTTANRSPSTSVPASPASCHAWCAAMSAAASERSSRRILTRSMTPAGSTFIWAAIRTGSCAAQSWVSGATPERPATMASQVDATSPPSGVVAPSPVTTTSGRDIRQSSSRVTQASRRGLLDVRHGVAHRLEVLHLVIRDLDAELLLGRHHDLDHGQRVHVQVVGERLPLGDVVRVHAGHLFEDLSEAGGDLVTGRHRYFLPQWMYSRAANDLPGVGEAAAEAEEQDRCPGGDLPPLDQLGQGQRHTRRGGVAGLDDVLGDHLVGDPQLAGQRFDDAQVGLVRHERGQVPGRDAGRGAGPLGQLRQRGGRPPEDRLTTLLDVRAPALDGDHIALLRRGTPQHRPDARLLVRPDGGDHGRAGPVAEEHAPPPVGPVGDVGALLRADDQR